LGLKELAEIADKILETTLSAAVASTTTHQPPPKKNGETADTADIMLKLLTKMEQLTSRMEKYEAKQNENRTRSRSRSRSEKFENCWYHHKFGEKAKKCVKPCAYSKKRTGGTEVSAASVPQTISRRLFATDQNTNTQFLIDTGADVSVVPAKIKDNSARNLAGFDLQSADGSAIKVFGQRTLSLNLGLRRLKILLTSQILVWPL
jgi:hypothetical protein